MSTIDIRRSHTLPREEAKKRAEILAKSMQSRFDLDWHWQGDSLLFEAPRGAARGTRGQVDVTDQEVRVRIDLPLVLRVVARKVESKVHEKLGQVL